jgi:hypothetical protein
MAVSIVTRLIITVNTNHPTILTLSMVVVMFAGLWVAWFSVNVVGVA